MIKELEGYVVYCRDAKKEIPMGVVSDSYDCKARTAYIPNRLKKYLVEIEDRRFYQHKGIDIRGISRALVENIKTGKIIQGGSTITQQLARNLLRNNSKSLSRKLLEVIKAIHIEKHNSKDEILNLYFNNIYFGKNIWGVRAAGLHYFGKEVERLTQSELLYLITILRGPNLYSCKPEVAKKRYNILNNVLYQRKYFSERRFKRNLETTFQIQNIPLPTIKNVSMPFIMDVIDNKHKIVKTTIVNEIQNFVKQFVSESKYPVSIIAISHGKVVAFASSYGTDYPFIAKSNVGSTLKPFLYCYLRDNGVSQTEKFDSTKNEMLWRVREVDYSNAELNLEEALFRSNNNAFLNAANKIGINNTLQFLAKLFNRSDDDFYLSSILGATKSGISIYELALAYSDFFNQKNLTESKRECLLILNRVLHEKLGLEIQNAFLKTGTTNDNKERYAVLGIPDLTYAVLRNENEINDDSKEGGFMNQISRGITSMFRSNRNYSWI